MGKNVYTVTLNPAFDIHYKIDDFKPYSENYVGDISIFAGGKGINVSRALGALGVENKAIAVLGRENADRFEALLNGADIDCIPIYCEGAIRENITIHTKGSPETRISVDTFNISKRELGLSFEAVDCQKGDMIIFAGRVPKGIAKSDVIERLLHLKSKGALLCIDSNSFDLEDIRKLSPWLIKPNEVELEQLTGIKIKEMSDVLEASKSFLNVGVENTLISLGEKGAMLFSDGTAYYAKVPKIEPLSTIGAGDSMIAGFVSAYIDGQTNEACLKTACATGTAACLTEGTDPPRKADIDRIINVIVIR